MIIRLPRKVEIDLDNIPEDFDQIVRDTFRDYTEETRDDYCFEDKLCFIDRCVELLRKVDDPDDEVMKLMKDYLEYEVREYATVPEEGDYLCFDFMEQCFRAGREKSRLYSDSEKYAKNRRDHEKIEKLLLRIMRVVIDYEPEEADE